MKKLYALLAIAMAGIGTAHAQWNTNATPKLIFDAADKGDYYASNPKAVRTPDKKTWIAWRTMRSFELNGAVHSGSCAYLQLLDRDGVPQFDEPILVNDHVTPSWWSEYSLCAAPDGSAIITVADSRGEEAELPADERNGRTFYPAIYKVDQEGNFLWGLDGICFDWAFSAPFTSAAVAGNYTWFIFRQSASNGEEKIESDGAYLVRIDADGTWTEPFKLSDDAVGNFQIIASEGDDFLLFSDTPDGACVTRYSPELESVWGETVTYDEYKYDGYAMNPYKIVSDGNGGACVAFVYPMGGFTHNIRVQHINADGSLGFGLTGLSVANTLDNDYDYCGISVNTENEEILVDFESKQPSTEDVMLQKFSFDGDYLFDELGLTIAAKDSRTNVYAWGQVGNGAIPGTTDWIVVYRDVQAWSNASFIIRRLDANGTQVWKRTIGREIDPTNTQLFVEKEATYLIYRETRSGKEPGIKIFRIGNDGSYNVVYDDAAAISDAQRSAPAAQRFYSIDGKQLQQPRSGLNIVKQADGTVVKRIEE